MPKLTRKAVPVKVSQRQAIESLKYDISKKKWASSKIESTALLLQPFYLLEFDLFRTEGKEGAEIVSEHSTEKIAFNPDSRELDREKTPLFQGGELTNEISEEAEPKVIRSPLGTSEAKRIASLIFSKEKGIPVEKIIVSGFEAFYYPYWEIKVSINGFRTEVKIDAVDGSFSGKEIPSKKQSASELTMETFTELRQPAAWLGYFENLFLLILKGLKGLFSRGTLKWLWRNVFKRRYFNYLLMALLAVLLFFLLTDYFFA